MPQSRIDPAVQSILDKARSTEALLMEALRDTQEREARTERARRAWLRVAGFRDRAIPAELRGKALWRRYAELIVELGQVLRDDGWQANVDAVTPGTPPKQCALEMLRRAMDADTESVATIVEGCIDTLFILGLQADSWLREGLMYEVLGIQPPPESLSFDQAEPEQDEWTGAPSDQAGTGQAEGTGADRDQAGTEQAEGGTPLDAILPSLLSASDIAQRIHRNKKSVSSFLSRFADKNRDCRVENASKRKNEPGYLYRTADVWPALEKWLKEE